MFWWGFLTGWATTGVTTFIILVILAAIARPHPPRKRGP